MAATITRTPWIDDDGTGTTGTVINNAVKTELYNQIDELAGKIEGADTTEAFAAQHDPATGAHKAITATTVTATGNIDGGAVLASVLARAPYFYEGQRPQPIGWWQAVPFNAANFWGGWVVDAADVSVNRITLIGKTLTWNLYIDASTVPTSGSVAATIPGSFLTAVRFQQAAGSTDYGTIASQKALLISAEAGASAVSLYPAGVGWATNTNVTSIRFLISFEIQ